MTQLFLHFVNIDYRGERPATCLSSTHEGAERVLSSTHEGTERVLSSTHEGTGHVPLQYPRGYRESTLQYPRGYRESTPCSALEYPCKCPWNTPGVEPDTL